MNAAPSTRRVSYTYSGEIRTRHNPYQPLDNHATTFVVGSTTLVGNELELISESKNDHFNLQRYRIVLCDGTRMFFNCCN